MVDKCDATSRGQLPLLPESKRHQAPRLPSGAAPEQATRLVELNFFVIPWKAPSCAEIEPLEASVRGF